MDYYDNKMIRYIYINNKAKAQDLQDLLQMINT